MIEQILSQTQEQRMQMVLAPQMRQSLEILQVPMLELRSLIQQELEKNPTIEDQPTPTEQVEIEPGMNEDREDKDKDLADDMQVLSQLDDEWRDYFNQEQQTYARNPDRESKHEYFLNSLSSQVTLQDHLMDQLQMSDLSEREQRLGTMIIGSIDEDGFLTVSPEELATNTGEQPETLQKLVEHVQEFDPIGVGAADLSECLLIQLRRLGLGDSVAAQVAQQHLQQLAAHKYHDIARALHLDDDAVQEAAKLISTLEPRPGRIFNDETTAYVLPEIIIFKEDGEYVISMNDDQLPHLRISRNYRSLLENPDTPADVKEYIKERIRAGAFLIKSIEQRQQTLYNITREIVRIQEDFFEQGIAHLHPLTMAEVAGILGIHETTVSRAIANKYMQTPRGVFEMKYFFTPGYKTASGEEVSNKSVKDAIQKLVAKENPAKPLSDQGMTNKLKEVGYPVARRTVAKYREALNIPPSHMRKQG